ncbi:MAG TPA: MarR family transcriptional regulator [Gemmatimonadales bacterium]|nr:MarR family transcriptional regulator [Gemmatimonadales bacterium]
MTARATPVHREIKQRRPFPSPAQEAIVALFRTTDRLRRRIAQVLEPSGVTLQQYNVLRILRGAGEGGLPTLEIVERMIEQTPGITRLLDRLERKRLVSRERCPSDRRQVTCRITESGLTLLAGLDATVDRTDEELLGLEPAELRRFTALLDRIRGGLGEPD